MESDVDRCSLYDILYTSDWSFNSFELLKEYVSFIAANKTYSLQIHFAHFHYTIYIHKSPI